MGSFASTYQELNL